MTDQKIKDHLPCMSAYLPWAEKLTSRHLKKTADENRIQFIDCFIESFFSIRRIYQNGHLIVSDDKPTQGIGVRYFDSGRVFFFPFHGFSMVSQAGVSPVIQALFRGTHRPTPDDYYKLIPDAIKEAQILQLLCAAHDTAWNHHWAVEAVTVEWNEKYGYRKIINSDQCEVAEYFVEGTLTASATLINGDGEFHGMSEYRFYSDQTRPALSDAQEIGAQTVNKAVQRMQCQPFPKGHYPVILKAGQCGNLIHEMLAHALEADMVIAGLSFLAGGIGQPVASPLLNITDDALSVSLLGGIHYDDEGTPLQRTELIREGILRGYLHDRQTAEKSGSAMTGSARKENYASLPLPRFRHLSVEAGPHDPDEIIRSVDRGVLVESVRHGESDPCTGLWMAKAENAWWIEQGLEQYPVGPVLVMGRARSDLHHIESVGCDVAKDKTAAFCVKNNQSVSVDASHPTMKINHLCVTDFR